MSSFDLPSLTCANISSSVAGRRGALPRVALGEGLAGLLVGHDAEDVPRLGDIGQAEDEDRARRLSPADVLPLVVGHRADLPEVLPDDDEVAALQRAGLDEDRGDGAPALVHVRLDDPSDRRSVRIRLEIGDVRDEQHDIDEVLEALLRARRHRGERRVAAVLLHRDAVLGELTLHLVGVRIGLIDLVERHDHRDPRRLDVRDRLDRLRLYAVVGRDDEDCHVGDLCAPSTHGGEGLVPRRVEERHLPARVLDLIGTDVLGDAPGFARRDVRLADRVQEARLAVVDVADDRDHGRTGDHLRLVVVCPEDLLADRRRLIDLFVRRGELLLGAMPSRSRRSG